MTLAPNREYRNPSLSQAPSRAERRGVSRKMVIEAAKENILTIDLADLLCGPGKMRRIGAEWVGRCPLPDHEDTTPSFCVNLDENLFFCHGCLRGGDVVRLAALAWGYEPGGKDEEMAAADLLRQFGHEIPQRPASWYRKQARQQPVRDAIAQAKFDHLRRRLFRGLFAPSLVKIENPDERKREATIFWEATEPLARMMLERLAEVRS
jgi:hypothetical protein